MRSHLASDCCPTVRQEALKVAGSGLRSHRADVESGRVRVSEAGSSHWELAAASSLADRES